MIRTYTINGMTCEGCVAKVTYLLEQHSNISLAEIELKNNTATLTVEKEIAIEDAKDLMILCEKDIIEKNRYYHTLGKHIIEIDEFLGKNKGLLIAEIELKSKNEAFLKPDYLGIEVTGVEKYYNSSLNKNPFKNWV